MVTLKFKVQGETQLSRKLMLTVRKMERMEVFHKDAIEIVSARSDAIFDSNGSVLKNSPKWKPLKSSTHKAREERWGYYKNSKGKSGTLQWTGALRDTRTMKADKSRGIMEFTTDYAKYHARGGGNLPKRAIIDLDQGTNTKIMKALHTHLYHNGGIFGKQVV